VREHTAALAPPRALWVPFMLGRPFGAPGNVDFQRKVLLAALQLLERDDGPVLEDFPEDAPHEQLTPVPADLVCPVSFPRLKREGDLAANLVDEVSQLQAWHEVARRHRQRSTLGVTGRSPMEIAHYLAAWLKSGEGDEPAAWRNDLSKGDALKHACDELKAYYLESKSVQPGFHTSRSMLDWFWLDTAAGKALIEIRALAANSADATVKGVSLISIVPRAVEAMLQSAAR
jgi:hypothetical protein